MVNLHNLLDIGTCMIDNSFNLSFVMYKNKVCFTLILLVAPVAYHQHYQVNTAAVLAIQKSDSRSRRYFMEQNCTLFIPSPELISHRA
jgi:hypothetical protein